MMRRLLKLLLSDSNLDLIRWTLDFLLDAVTVITLPFWLPIGLMMLGLAALVAILSVGYYHYEL